MMAVALIDPYIIEEVCTIAIVFPNPSFFHTQAG